MNAWCLAAGLLMLAAAPGFVAQSHAAEAATALDCKAAAQLIRTPGLADKAPKVEGVIEVVENMTDVKPPMLVGCPGKVRVLCMPKTAPAANPGDKVKISGKIDGAGDNYITVQPCTVSPAN